MGPYIIYQKRSLTHIISSEFDLDHKAVHRSKYFSTVSNRFLRKSTPEFTQTSISNAIDWAI